MACFLVIVQELNSNIIGSHPTSMRYGVKQTNFFYLLIALLVFLIAFPLADDFVIGSAPVVRAILFSTVLIIGVRSLQGSGLLFSAGISLVVVGVILSIAATRFLSDIFQYGALLSLIGFLLVAFTHTIREVVFGTAINVNRLVGAVCVYLLFGVIWALSYSVLEFTVPGSFAGFETSVDRGWDSEWLYFSFVTMTTLGYGDLLPISATARALAYMQAVFGQFYVAVLVAGLVGAYIGQKDKPQP